MENIELEGMRIQRDAALKVIRQGVENEAKMKDAAETLRSGFREVRSLRRAGRKREAWSLVEQMIDAVEAFADIRVAPVLADPLAILEEMNDGR